MASASEIGHRIFSILFVVALLAVVAYFALQAIPSAQRPTLHERAKHNTSQHR